MNTKHSIAEHVKYSIRHCIVWAWPILSLAITQYINTWSVDETALLWLLWSMLVEFSDRQRRVKNKK